MRKALAAAMLLFSTPAIADGVGPEIAYVKAGTYSEIYLIQPDGSGKRLLYRSPQRQRIFTLDMKPQGGELAFEEVSAYGSTSAVLKIVRYDNAGARLETKTQTLSGCRILSLDYHPSGGNDLLILDTCTGGRRLNTTTMSATPVAIPAGINKAAWRNASGLLYNRSTAQASEMLVAPAAAPASATSVGTVRLAEMMDVSTSGQLVLVDPVDYGNLSLFNIGTGSEHQAWQIGNYGRFSPDDTEVAYVSGHDVRGSYIFIRKTSGPGTAFRLASKGPFGIIDWRD